MPALGMAIEEHAHPRIVDAVHVDRGPVKSFKCITDRVEIGNCRTIELDQNTDTSLRGAELIGRNLDISFFGVIIALLISRNKPDVKALLRKTGG
ncbi:MAG: hypothetical protein RDA78_03475 [Roseibium sp.]|uniref:hypothetical protein n=1 Tax=Roseibium sp. TaxID=1936156 RepID=UPI003D9C6117